MGECGKKINTMVPPFIESPRLVIGGYYVTNHICGNKN
jgi:hypothetical protein